MTGGRTENAPLSPKQSISLRLKNVDPSLNTGGAFDGNNKKSEPFSYMTRRKGVEPPIPMPPQEQIDEANGRTFWHGLNPNTNLPYQPEWLSVLQKREEPWMWVRWLFCNCLCNPTYTYTRAHLIWLCNFVCAMTHIYWTRLVLREGWEKGDKMNAVVWRLSPKWNSTAADGYTATLVDNCMPIRIDFLTATFFGLSALFHTLAVFCGLFDRWILLYWRQLDLGFFWWRWLEYSLSAPTMAIGICLITGLREQNTLASVFMLMWTTMMCGLLTELWSRPHKNPDTRRFDMERWQGDTRPVSPGKSWGELDDDQMHKRAVYTQLRRRNYILRMVPHVIGIFPYTAAWVIVINNFFVQLEDLKLADQDIYDRIPDFVPWAVVGSVLIFSLFTFPQWWYQWAPPKLYWKTEIIYCLLSLTSKVFLGGLLYANVVMAASFNEALALDQNTTATD